MSTTDAWAAAVDAGDPNPVERIGASILDRVLGNASARMVYGDPVQHGDRTVIPVARVTARFGFGGGGGRGTNADGPASGSGGGGGGAVDAKPIGFIEVTAHGSEFHEIEDSTQIALAGIRVGMVVVTLVLLKVLFLRRSKRKQKKNAAEIAAPVVQRQRRFRSHTPVVEPEPEPLQRAARRWMARAH